MELGMGGRTASLPPELTQAKSARWAFSSLFRGRYPNTLALSTRMLRATSRRTTGSPPPRFSRQGSASDGCS